MDKAIVILTNFFDAEKIIGDRVILYSDPLQLIKLDPEKLHVLSIALSHPKFDALPNVNNFFESRLDFFCPTYDLLLKYKEDNDWNYYVEKYKSILKGRKEHIKEWFESLIPDHVYILCCWENTSGKSHCHRQLLHKAFLASDTAKKYIVTIYRNGERVFANKTKKDSEDEE